MRPDRVSSLGPLAIESDVLLTAPCGPAIQNTVNTKNLWKIQNIYGKYQIFLITIEHTSHQ